ncbi:uncharacterized protein DS421_18g606640 [Arachis hypogaea]|nr:uncharacterized protein DS421_18g606640 [Arachis hypogaea]
MLGRNLKTFFVSWCDQDGTKCGRKNWINLWFVKCGQYGELEILSSLKRKNFNRMKFGRQ